MLRLPIENTLDREEKIMAEWLKTSLIDIVELIGGGTPKTSKAEYWGGNINWLSVKDFNNENRYVYSTEKTITEEGLNHSSTKLLRKDDIIISARGTVGELSMIPFPMAFNQSCYGIRAKDGINSTFLYYLIKHSVRKLKSMTHGSVFDTITRDTFANIEVAIPDIETQQRIAKMLADIDDKVENNQRINNNLEQQADALYQSFFSPKSGTQGVLVTLDEYCSIFTGKKNANASVDGGKYKFFTCAPEALQIDSYIYDGNAIIVSGNGAYTGRTRFYSGKFDLYQRTYACTLLDNVNPEFIFPLYWFVKLELSKKIMGGTRGSAIPYIVMNDLAKFEFIYNEQTFTKYMPIFKSLTEAIQANEFENEKLAQMRDLLLPELMSGELDVSNIEL